MRPVLHLIKQVYIVTYPRPQSRINLHDAQDLVAAVFGAGDEDAADELPVCGVATADGGNDEINYHFFDSGAEVLVCSADKSQDLLSVGVATGSDSADAFGFADYIEAFGAGSVGTSVYDPVGASVNDPIGASVRIASHYCGKYTVLIR